MWTKISKGLTIAVTVLSVLFLGVAALTSAVSTNWKERATKDFPKSRVAELEKEKADLNAGIKAAEEQQQASVKAIEADTQGLTAKNTGREALLEAELEQLIEQAHVLSEQLEAEAKKVQLKQDEDTRLREEVTRLRSQYEDLVDQRQAALADVQRLRDLVFQARGVLERAERRKAALVGAEEKEKKEYDR
jgi:hypothetical protein